MNAHCVTESYRIYSNLFTYCLCHSIMYMFQLASKYRQNVCFVYILLQYLTLECLFVLLKKAESFNDLCVQQYIDQELYKYKTCHYLVEDPVSYVFCVMFLSALTCPFVNFRDFQRRYKTVSTSARNPNFHMVQF